MRYRIYANANWMNIVKIGDWLSMSVQNKEHDDKF